MDPMGLGKNGKETPATGLESSFSLQGLAGDQYRVGLRCIKVNNKACLHSLVSCQQSVIAELFGNGHVSTNDHAVIEV